MEFWARQAMLERKEETLAEVMTPSPVVDAALDPTKGIEFQRIERRIYSPFWRVIHNLVAHPMLVVHRPTGERLHNYTADKMYEPRDGLSPIITDHD